IMVQTPNNPITYQDTIAVVNSFREYSGTVLLDHRFTYRTTMYVRYNIDDALIHRPFDNVGAIETEPIRPSNLAVQLTHIFSPNILNEVKAGMNRSAFHHPVTGSAPVAVSSVPGLDALNAI